MSDGFVDKTLITPIRLDDAQGAWEFDPQADITSLELALIAQMFTAMSIRRTRLDWREYLTRAWRPGTADSDLNPLRGPLSRHFKDV